MKIIELLAAIERIADEKGLSKPYIVGGLVRDKMLNRTNDFNDIDLTTGDQGIHFLAREAAERLASRKTIYQVMSDGHARISIGGLKVDFSSNFRVPGIKKLLEDAGVEDPSEMRKELYSRDFTCNAALMTMDLKKVLDPTGLAAQDIGKKLLKTCLPPRLTLGFDNKRVVRIPYMAAKLGFDIDGDIIDWVRAHPSALKNVRPEYITKKINKALLYNRDITLQVLDDMNLWRAIPATPDLAEEMAGRIQRI